MKERGLRGGERCEADTVFIQANDRQMLGAKISRLQLQAATPRPGQLRRADHATPQDYPRLMQQGQSILRAGHVRDWDPDDLQSFTPLRFAPPQPDGLRGAGGGHRSRTASASATSPICSTATWSGKAIMAVPRPGHNQRDDYIATSVMLLDCAKLKHWDFDQDLDDLFAHRFDYVDWIELKREDRVDHRLPRARVERLRPADARRPSILHTTKRRTQPWKTGLPVDYTLRERGPLDFLRRWPSRRYEPHPDRNQEALVYSLLAEMVDTGEVTSEELVGGNGGEPRPP